MYYFRAIIKKMKDNTAYHFNHKVSAACMVIMLLWLTVSAPFVQAAQQERAKHELKSCKTSPLAGSEEESTDPYGNNTEEKAPSSTSLAEEFLHDNDRGDMFSQLVLRSHALENADTYHAYHVEQLVPPPDAA